MNEVVKNVFQIAIDGPAQSGKGTNARLLARKLGYTCIGTGDLYRGVTMHFMDGQVLHAVKLILCHPVSGDAMEFNAPLPEYFERVLECGTL